MNRKQNRRILTLFTLLLFLSRISISLADDLDNDYEESLRDTRKADLKRVESIPENYKTRKDVFIIVESSSQKKFVCRLVNATKEPIKFTGYGVNSPWFRIQKKTLLGWKERKVGWFCGTGLYDPILPARASAKFVVDQKDQLSILKIGINYWRSEESDPENKYEEVWSEEVNR